MQLKLEGLRVNCMYGVDEQNLLCHNMSLWHTVFLRNNRPGEKFETN